MAKNKLSQLGKVSYFKPPGAYRPIMDLRGMTFGDITVLNIVTTSPVKWLCQCSCGNTLVRSTSNVTRRWHGHHNSCGCKKQKFAKTKLQENNTTKFKPTHGDSGTRLWRCWQGMKQRCKNKKHPDYKDYGGRGIKIYEKWDEYEYFKKWAIENGYKENLTIDRIDVNGNYCPENCRWATIHQQIANRRKKSNTGITGVYRTRSNSYIACLTVNQKSFRKTFKTINDAIAYRKSLERSFL